MADNFLFFDVALVMAVTIAEVIVEISILCLKGLYFPN